MIGVRFRSLPVQLGLCSVLVVLVACGGAASPPPAAPSATTPEAKSPASDLAGEPESVEQAQQQIAAARAELASAARADANRFAPEPSSPASPGGATAPAAGAAPRTPSSTQKSTTRPTAPAAEPPPAGAPSCGSPCRALASMRRAVSALCRMTGTEDTRCVDAKRTLADSEGRIAPCSC